jgi:hypothetical protein
MKCKETREAKDVQDVTMKNGKPAQQGVCPTCGTKMFRIGAAKPAAAGAAPAKVERRPEGRRGFKAKTAKK